MLQDTDMVIMHMPDIPEPELLSFLPGASPPLSSRDASDCPASSRHTSSNTCTNCHRNTDSKISNYQYPETVGAFFSTVEEEAVGLDPGAPPAPTHTHTHARCDAVWCGVARGRVALLLSSGETRRGETRRPEHRTPVPLLSPHLAHTLTHTHTHTLQTWNMIMQVSTCVRELAEDKARHKTTNGESGTRRRRALSSLRLQRSLQPHTPPETVKRERRAAQALRQESRRPRDKCTHKKARVTCTHKV